MSLNQYSQTPASNDLSGYFATGMAPSSVKTAGWDIMADLAMIFGLPTSAGTANAQTITNTRPYTALVSGLCQGTFIPGFTNTGAMTLQIDGLTAKNVYANGVAAIAGMVVSGVPCKWVYDGTNINIMNPQRSTGSFTLTLATGLTTTPTGTINIAVEPSGKYFSAWPASNINGTSNTNTMTGTGVPAIIQTATSHFLFAEVEDNGTGAAGGISTGASSGTWAFNKNGLSNGFTTSGTKGILAGFTVSGPLD